MLKNNKSIASKILKSILMLSIVSTFFLTSVSAATHAYSVKTFGSVNGKSNGKLYNVSKAGTVRLNASYNATWERGVNKYNHKLNANVDLRRKALLLDPSMGLNSIPTLTQTGDASKTDTRTMNETWTANQAGEYYFITSITSGSANGLYLNGSGTITTP